MNELKDKVAIVTGCASLKGIGYAIASRLGQAGASLMLVDTGRIEPLQEVAQQISAQPGAGGKMHCALHDLAVSGQAEAMVAEADRVFGRVDVLCNNAGIRCNKVFGEYTREDFNTSVAVNLAAPFFASQAVLPIMRRQGGGRIIHTASQLGTVAFNTRAVYGLTKAALIHLTKSMSLELSKENIVVNAIGPGPVYTQPIIDRELAEPKLAAERLRYVPMGRYGKPEEIAELVFFLASSAPAFLTGETIIIDGGYTAH